MNHLLAHYSSMEAYENRNRAWHERPKSVTGWALRVTAIWKPVIMCVWRLCARSRCSRLNVIVWFTQKIQISSICTIMQMLIGKTVNHSNHDQYMNKKTL